MPIIRNELATNARGGTELMIARLEKSLPNDLLEHFDIYPSRVREFNTSRPSVYWAHDLVSDPECEHLKDRGWKRYDLMVFVSNWQMQQFSSYYGITGENCVVINNAIEPFPKEVVDKWDSPCGTEANPLRLIYHTTPHRGLELLWPVYNALYEEFTDQGIHIHLDVYSSFSIYGWEQRDQAYAELFEVLRNHPGITYHGAVDNSEVREALTKAHVFAFPSIWMETSCLALIEAMGAGVICVHSNLAALPETSGGFTGQYPYVSDMQTHANRFYGALRQMCYQIVKSDMRMLVNLAKQRVDVLYDCNNTGIEWQNVLNAVKSR